MSPKGKRSKSVPRLVKWQNAAKAAKAKTVKKVIRQELKKDFKKNPPSFIRKPFRNYRPGNRMAAAPLAYGSVIRSKEKKFNNGKGTRIEATEFLQDVAGSVGFVNTTYFINPGLVDSFPWLGQMGALFEHYIVRRMCFTYKQSCASITTGKIMMATNYDARDNSFPDKPTMMSYNPSIDSSPWLDFQHEVRPQGKDVLKKYFTRVGDAPTDTDIRMYDIGNFQMATQGQQDTSVIGELRVHYVIDFFTPKILSLDNAGFLSNSIFLGSSPTNAFDGAFTQENKSIPNAQFIDEVVSVGAYRPLYNFLADSAQFLKEGYYNIEHTFLKRTGAGAMTGLPSYVYVDMVEQKSGGDYAGVVNGTGTAGVNTAQAFCALAGGFINMVIAVASTLTITVVPRYSSLPADAFQTLPFMEACQPEKTIWSHKGKAAYVKYLKYHKVSAAFMNRALALPSHSPEDIVKHFGKAVAPLKSPDLPFPSLEIAAESPVPTPMLDELAERKRRLSIPDPVRVFVRSGGDDVSDEETEPVLPASLIRGRSVVFEAQPQPRSSSQPKK